MHTQWSIWNSEIAQATLGAWFLMKFINTGNLAFNKVQSYLNATATGHDHIESLFFLTAYNSDAVVLLQLLNHDCHHSAALLTMAVE